MRNWQEQGFRDLKSAGWQLNVPFALGRTIGTIPGDPRARDRFGSVAWRPGSSRRQGAQADKN